MPRMVVESMKSTSKTGMLLYVSQFYPETNLNSILLSFLSCSINLNQKLKILFFGKIFNLLNLNVQLI